MVARLLVAVALLTGTPAQAADYIPACSTVEGPAYPVPMPMPVTRLPAQVNGGTCGPYIVGFNATGVVGGYWCQPDKTRRGYLVAGAARWTAYTPAMLADLASIPMAADPAEAGRAFRAKYVTESIWNMTDVICESAGTDWRLRMNAAEPPILVPGLAVWKTPSTGNRIWVSAGGKLVAPVSPARLAAPGSTCDCVTTKIVIGTVTYCALPGAPATEVTSCKVVP